MQLNFQDACMLIDCHIPLSSSSSIFPLFSKGEDKHYDRASNAGFRS